MAYTFKQNLVSSSKYSVKCPYTMKAEYIVVHNTYNDASAENEIKYMIGNSNQTSYHYAIDDKHVIQAIPYDRNTWNAGDGSNGNGNRKGISIEICYSKSGGTRFVEAEKNAALFVAKLLKQYNWGIDKVKKHQDFSGKYCPHRTLDTGWQRFLDMVKVELDKLNKPATTSQTTTTKVVYQVIVGSHSTKESANKVKSKLDSKGYNGVWISSIEKDGKTYYRVICGSYSDKTNADNVVKRLTKEGYTGIWINKK